MDKFQRNYILYVCGGDGKEYVFSYPLTIEFNIDRRALSSANTASIRLYNLNSNTRKAIFKDYYETATFRSVRLMAGYGDNLSEVLNGNIQEAKSFREEGSVNFITQIDCYDWSFAMMNAKSEWTMDSPEYLLPLPRSMVIDRLVSNLEAMGVARGVINKTGFDLGGAPYSRAFSPTSNNAWDSLRHETNDHCFIDNGTVHCMLDDDCFEGDVVVINSSTGLLSTPKKSKYLLKVDILFEPALKIGQRVELISTSESLYNGRYKIIGIQHNGIISGAVGGKCRTSLLLNGGELVLNLLTGETSHKPVPLG